MMRQSYITALLALLSWATISARQRADVKPQATVTAQSYPAEQVQAGQTVDARGRGRSRRQDRAASARRTHR